MKKAIILEIKHIRLNANKSLKLSFNWLLPAILLLSSIFMSNEMQAQACSSYTTWTPGMWIGPAGYNCAGGVQYYQTVSYNGRLYTHKGYCSNAGPGHWDFQDIGACTSCTNRTVGAASSSPTLCTNTAMISITHATTQVTGIASSTDLPAGVSASYSGNVITISGTPSATGTFNYTITPTSACGTDKATGTITVSPATVAGADQTICAGNAVTLTGSPTKGTSWTAYSLNPTGATLGNTKDGSATASFTTNASGTFYFVFSAGCTDTMKVSVNALPTLAAITGTTTTYLGSTTTLSNAITGGVWSSGTSGIATINSSGVVSGVAVGNSTITYTVTNSNSCSSNITKIVTVNPSANP